jgi:hypothetical protein
MRPIRTPRTNLTYKHPDRAAVAARPPRDRHSERVPLRGSGWVIDIPGLGKSVPVTGPGTYPFKFGPDDTVELTARPTHAAIRSAWQLTDEEQVHVARTGLIELTIWGEPIPPVALAVIEPGDFTDYGWGPENEQPETPIDRSHANMALGHLYVELCQEHGLQLEAPELLQAWYAALAATSAGADDPTDPDARPGQDHRDPRQT